MSLFIDDPDFKLHVGDVSEILRQLPAESVQTCVTSPPYWAQRDYGMEGQLGMERTPDEYVQVMVDVFHEVGRVLKDDGTLWLNIGDSYASNWGMGAKGRRSSWMSGKSGDLEGKGWGVETIIPPNSFAKPRADGIKPKDLVGIPWMLAFALRADGWYLRSEIIWNKPNAMPESIHDRPTCAHEHIFLLAKNQRYFYDKDAVKEDAEWERWGKQTNPKYGSAQGKGALVKERSKKAIYEFLGQPGDQDGMTKNLRNVWTVRTQPYADAHFATFPEDLIEPCIKAGSREGDTVFDPFMGSGTTALVARKLGRHSLGIELNPEYAVLCAQRTSQQSLLA